MLNLAEETVLLLYTHRRPAKGVAEYDTFGRYSGELRLLAGAALMELVLLGRAKVRTVSPEGRRLRALLLILMSLVMVALFVGLPIEIAVAGSRLPGAIAALVAFVSVALIPLLVALAVGWANTRLLRDRLAIVDRTLTGDGVLDETLQRIAQMGEQAPIRTYLRSFGLRVLPKMRDTLIAHLQQKGLVTPPTPGPTIFGLVDRRLVRREHPEFQAVGERMRQVVLEYTIVDPRAVAVLMLFAWSTYYHSVGWQRDAGIYQFFAPHEYGQVRSYLRALRRRDPALTAQVGPDLYEGLRAIAVGVMQLRKEQSGGD